MVHIPTRVLDVYKTQRAAEWRIRKNGRKVQVDDIWPLPKTA